MASSPTYPLVATLYVRDPADLLPALARLHRPFLLTSSLADERNRWTFFGAEPFEAYRAHNYDIAVARWRALAARVGQDDPVPTLVPFTGGAVGYWAYDFGRRLERLPAVAGDDLHLPDFVLGFYDVIGVYDHAARQAWLFSSGLPYGGDRRAAHAAARLEDTWRRLSEPAGAGGLPVWSGAPGAAPRSTFTRAAYERAVDRVREHIARGDLFQANLSQRWTVPLVEGGATGLDAGALADTSAALCAALAAVSPAPHSAWLGCGDHAVVSASPERFLELRGRRAETRPIKGTRPRGGDDAEDRRLGAELVASAKDRAENVMIVDVLRNDLGRVCETGSVRALRLCELEAFPQVFHLTSTIEGRLEPGRDAFDLLHACFPGGSITGAPKIRAMEIIDSIEPVRRHVYTGAVGYVDWRGDADWNIAIRTALVTTRAIHFAAGGGITADSDPPAEFEETLHKSAGLRRAIERALGRPAGALQETA
jgi:para-aminobenzoate synthetase component 1